MSLHLTLIIGHLIGTVLGVGGATFIEVDLNQALKDGKMEDDEKLFMGKAFLVTRIGMVIGLITGIGFILEYWAAGQLFRLMDGVFWAKMLIFVIIVVNAYLLHKHKVGLYWGSAFSFISWWAVLILGIFLTNGMKFFPGNVPVSFLSIMAVYIAVVVIGAQVLHRIRLFTKAPVPPQTPPPTPAA